MSTLDFCSLLVYANCHGRRIASGKVLAVVYMTKQRIDKAEIEVTPAMIEAGVAVYAELEGEVRSVSLVEGIFRAMVEASARADAEDTAEAAQG